MPATADVTTWDGLYILNMLRANGAPAPEDVEEFDGHLNLMYAERREAVLCYEIAQQQCLPLQSLDTVTFAPWECDDEGAHYVAFEYEELDRGN